MKWYYCKDCKRWMYTSGTIIRCIWCGKELNDEI